MSQKITFIIMLCVLALVAPRLVLLEGRIDHLEKIINTQTATINQHNEIFERYNANFKNIAETDAGLLKLHDEQRKLILLVGGVKP